MPTSVMTAEKFSAEAERRLIDTFELMLLLGLRSRQAVWARVEAGKLPKPVFTRQNHIALWDRDAVLEATDKEGKG
jgi:predicted DNA-binding transcriptional regulator AlpA